MACQLIKENLDKIPGDSRALIGFLTFNKSVNFYNLRVSMSYLYVIFIDITMYVINLASIINLFLVKQLLVFWRSDFITSKEEVSCSVLH